MDLRMLLSLITFAGAWSACGGQIAKADYMLPSYAESYVVVPDSWKLARASSSAPISHLECTYKGTKHTWPIDRFILADRLDSNSICAGDWKKLTDSYLNAESQLSQSNKAAIEVVSTTKGGPLTVGGIWNFGEPPKYERCFRHWSLPPRARKALNPEFCQQQFNAIGNR